MPRPPRVHPPGLPVHIVLRGNNRRKLFSYVRDRRRFLHLLRDAGNRYGLTTESVGLMTNHAHVLGLPETETAVSDAIKSCTERYASERNRRLGASGKLFEQRFYSKPISTDKQYGLTQAYIETNSRRARMVRHPADERWSTYGFFAGVGDPRWRALWEDWIQPSSWYLALGPTRALRQERYALFVEQSLERAMEPAHADQVARVIQRAGGPVVRRPNGRSAL